MAIHTRGVQLGQVSTCEVYAREGHERACLCPYGGPHGRESVTELENMAEFIILCPYSSTVSFTDMLG